MQESYNRIAPANSIVVILSVTKNLLHKALPMRFFTAFRMTVLVLSNTHRSALSNSRGGIQRGMLYSPYDALRWHLRSPLNWIDLHCACQCKSYGGTSRRSRPGAPRDALRAPLPMRITEGITVQTARTEGECIFLVLHPVILSETKNLLNKALPMRFFTGVQNDTILFDIPFPVLSF